jgi:hypothetical protein
MERLRKQNDKFFLNLMKLNATFYWRGHLLELQGNKIQVSNMETLRELKECTSEDIHSLYSLRASSGNSKVN